MDDGLVDFSEYAQPAALLRYLQPAVPHLLVPLTASRVPIRGNSR
jgi:hypothetical protein